MDSESEEVIYKNQRAWASRCGIRLVKGSPGTKKPLLYVEKLDDNLFEPLCPEARLEYEHGNGTPLAGKNGRLPHLHAVHNSDALAANVFHYWKMREPSRVARYLDVGAKEPMSPSIHFEKKFHILPRTPPNIDVAIRHQNGCCCDWVGIESKFVETYPAKRRKLFDDEYFGPSVCWSGLTTTRELAESFRGNGKEFEATEKHLDRGQLIKHLLGLQRRYREQGSDPKRARLVYLWYHVDTEESHRLQQEVVEFNRVLQSDGVLFKAMTWQELISRIVEAERANHGCYVEYLRDRYL